MADHGGKLRRLVLVPSPLQGHMTPMLQLGTYLHSKGFTITIAHSQFKQPDPFNHPDFIFHPLPDNLPANGLSTGFMPFMQALNDNCKPHLIEYLIKIMKEDKDCDKESTVMIIHDNLMFFAGSVARELGLSNMVLRSSSAAFFPAAMIIPKLHQQGQFPVQDSMLQEIVLDLHPFRYKDLPFIKRPIEQTLESLILITPKTPPSAFIWNTIEFLEQSVLTQIRNHFKVPIFTIGPLHKIIPTPSTSLIEEDTSCISWLNKQTPKSVIYVSLGSIVNVDEKVATEMAWGLANSNQPFIWVIRPGSVNGSKWFEFLPDSLVTDMQKRGLIVKWAPQKEILAHNSVGGFWSHCGWNSTLESVSEGVPILCQPWDVDQLLNARYLTYVWKIGVEIVVDRREIEGAIRRILIDNEGDEMRQRAIEIQVKIKGAISHGGCTQSSLNDLVEFIMSC